MNKRWFDKSVYVPMWFLRLPWLMAWAFLILVFITWPLIVGVQIYLNIAGLAHWWGNLGAALLPFVALYLVYQTVCFLHDWKSDVERMAQTQQEAK